MNIIEADFSDPNHSEAIIKLLNEYALDPMGGGRELPEHVKTNLVKEQHKRDTSFHVGVFYKEGCLAC